jgi:hypothetical protein
MILFSRVTSISISFHHTWAPILFFYWLVRWSWLFPLTGPTHWNNLLSCRTIRTRSRGTCESKQGAPVMALHSVLPLEYLIVTWRLEICGIWYCKFIAPWGCFSWQRCQVHRFRQGHKLCYPNQSHNQYFVFENPKQSYPKQRKGLLIPSCLSIQAAAQATWQDHNLKSYVVTPN